MFHFCKIPLEPTYVLVGITCIVGHAFIISIPEDQIDYYYYRSRNFIPHYVWRKTSRPSGVGISPWNNHLYICGMDSHSVLVVERAQAKIVTRLACEEMLCPVHIAFMKSLGEIYVTGKLSTTKD